MKKPKLLRLPKEGYLKLRGGGVHSSRKGKKGYDRKNEKDELSNKMREEDRENDE